MTRIAGVPAELSALSRALSGVAPDLQLTATRLGGVSLPEMPPSVAGVVSDTLGSVGGCLCSAALTVEREQLDVESSAQWLTIAGEGGRLMEVYPVPPLGFPGDGPFGLPGETFPGPVDVPPETPGFPDGPLPGWPLPGFGFPGEPRPPDVEPFPGIPTGPGVPDYEPHPGLGGLLPGMTVPPGIPGLPGLLGGNGPTILHSNDGEGGEGGEGDDGGETTPPGYPPPEDINTPPDDRGHILDGDEEGSGGGHRPGTGTPGKSEFPPGWSDDKIIGEIEDVAKHPGNVEPPNAPGGHWVATGERDGVELRVVIRHDGTIVTGYPTNLPRNPPAA
jgi:hypothetical protein